MGRISYKITELDIVFQLFLACSTLETEFQTAQETSTHMLDGVMGMNNDSPCKEYELYRLFLNSLLASSLSVLPPSVSF